MLNGGYFMIDLDKLYEWYSCCRSREFIEKHDKEQAWKQIQRRIQHGRKVRIWRQYASVAACLLLLLGIGWWWRTPRYGDAVKYKKSVIVAKRMSTRQAVVTHKGDACKVSVPMGAEYNEMLKDGTKVVVNAGATLVYPLTFVGDRREVALTGEAYFEVAHNKQNPFVVKTPTGSIEVLGTHFNVDASGGVTVVTLAEGCVRLHIGDRELIIRPGDQATMYSDARIEVKKVKVQNYTSWSTGVYEFTNASLNEITRQLSRWYNVSFDIEEAELGEARYTGIIVRAESLQNALNMLSTISELHFIINGERIAVMAKGKSVHKN